MKSRYDRTFNQLSKSDRNKIVEYAREIAMADYKANVTALDLSHNIELYSAIALMLNTEFGFGEKRLKQAIYSLNALLEEVHKTYELAETDTGWVCSMKLKEMGFDIESWVKEMTADGRK